MEKVKMEKLKVGIIGATGMVGQRFVLLLENHPYFEISALIAGPRSAGQKYSAAIEGRWKMATPAFLSVSRVSVTPSNNSMSCSASAW